MLCVARNDDAWMKCNFRLVTSMCFAKSDSRGNAFASKHMQSCKVYVCFQLSFQQIDVNAYSKPWKKTTKIQQNVTYFDFGWKLTSKPLMSSSNFNEVFAKWLPDKFNTFNWSNACRKSMGIPFISAIDSALKWRRFWKING